MKNLSVLEKVLTLFLLLSVLFGLYQYFTDTNFFNKLIAEDSFYENLTSLFLFLTSVLLFVRFLEFRQGKNIWWKIGILTMAVAMFFGAGEEISWGQRIFDVQSNDFFLENNAQQETNLHNMVVDGVKLNKLIFSNLMSICFGIYFLVLPILWKKVPKIKNLIDRFGLSVARPVQIFIFLFFTAIILLPIDHEKKWEMWEFVFALIMFMIVWNPLNKKEIFSKP